MAAKKSKIDPPEPEQPKANAAPQVHLLNREIGMLEFNRRVLAQAEDPNVPSLERLKYVCIVSSNLDEFFEIRMAELKEKMHVDLRSSGSDTQIPRETFAEVSRIAHQLVDHQYQLLQNSILPELRRAGVSFLRRSELNPAQREWIRDFFSAKCCRSSRQSVSTLPTRFLAYSTRV